MQVLLICLLITTINCFSQNIDRIKQIDIVVGNIKKSANRKHLDSSVQSSSYSDVSVKKIVSMVKKGEMLQQFQNKITITFFYTKYKSTESSNCIFFFDKKKLIKVEEVFETERKKDSTNWYFWDDKIKFFSTDSATSQERADFLIEYSKLLIQYFSTKNEILPQIDKDTAAKIFFIGDSLTSNDSTDINMNGNTSKKSWPWYMKKYLNADSTKYQFRNYAVAGGGMKLIREQVKRAIREQSLFHVNIAYILGPINDISYGLLTGEDAYREVRIQHEVLRFIGFKTVAITLTSRVQIPPFTQDMSQYIWHHVENFNRLLTDCWPEFSNVLIDLQNEPVRENNGVTIGWAGYEAPIRSIYFLDGCHFTERGKSQIAKYYAVPAFNMVLKNKLVVISFLSD